MKGICWRRSPEGMQQHWQWVWLDIAAEDMMLQRAGLHLMLQCSQFDHHKQMASGKRYLFEVAVVVVVVVAAAAAAAAVNKTTLPIGMENTMTHCHQV